MRALFLLIFSVIFLWSRPLTVAVAANVSYAVKDLIQTYRQKDPKSDIRVIVGSSGKLAAQIRHGAPYDLFLSADMGYPLALYHDKLGLEKPKTYAKGVLALLSVHHKKLSNDLHTLLSFAIKKIAVANPKTAPYGKAAREALQNAKIYERVKPKLIYGESVSQTLVYTLRVADAGLVAKSALFSPKLRRFREGKEWVEVDSRLYSPIEQGAVLLKPEGKDFYDFLFSPAAQHIFKAYGYRQP